MKPTIFLASDSTVQTYDKQHAPQTGWGQVLIRYFSDPGETIHVWHPEDSAFSQSTCYESSRIRIDNRAIGGRSARSFYEEGRFSDFSNSMAPGDYLFLQFAHNDANAGKPERYIPVDEYPDWLMKYVSIAREKNVTPVLITAIAMRTFQPDGTLPISFPDYRNAMLALAKKENLPCIDLGLLTRDYCQELGPEQTKDIFMWTIRGEFPGGPYCEGSEDNAHLKEKGALAFARLLCQGIFDCPLLKSLHPYLNPAQIKESLYPPK